MKKVLIIVGVTLVLFIALAVFFKFLNTTSSTTPNSGNNLPPVVGDVQGLVVENVQAGDAVSSPLKITGYVNGNGWSGFEGQVGSVSLQDKVGNVLDTETLTATTEWMTTTVRFEANLEFDSLIGESGKLVFKNENASGDPSRDRTVVIPLRFSPPADVALMEQSVVKVYFGNSKLDPKISCDKVFALTRVVPKTEAVGRAALEELLKGPVNAEKMIGYETSINENVKINSLTINKGVAKVDFNETLQNGVAGACRVSLIRLQIEETLKQFPTIQSVIISVDGKTEDILQP